MASSLRSRSALRVAPRLASRTGAISAWLIGMSLAACTAKSGGPPSGVSSQQSDLELPCDAKRVLENVCQQCHSSPPRNNAPFPLVTYADTRVVSNGEPLWQLMRVVVQSGVMPLPPVQMSPTDRETLSKWLDAGGPPRATTESCAVFVDSLESGVDESAAATDSISDEANGDSDGASAVDAGPVALDGLDASQAHALSDNDDGAASADAIPLQSD